MGPGYIANGTGASWLTSDTNGCCAPTPDAITLTASPAINLAVGRYTSEIILTMSSGAEATVVPVTLALEPSTASYFDELPGEITFSMAVNGNAPPSQALPIRNAGSGILAWTATSSTSDGGSWLTLSAMSGTAPSVPSVSINPANLPSNGAVAGTYTGQVLLTSGSDAVTVPVTVTVGDSVFEQINPLNSTKTLNSASNPLSQVIAVSSNDASFQFSATVVEGTGGAWLSTNVNGCCVSTPQAITVSANPAQMLPAGMYKAEIILTATNGTKSLVVPVSLTVEQPSASYFDELPGKLTFSMAASGKTPPAQLVQVRNAGSGTLNFTAARSTADGGNWITLSAVTGSAPYLLNVGINPVNLPSSGQVPGTFTGQVLLKSGSDVTSIPVSVTVGDSIFAQINSLSFTKPLNNANDPLMQVVTIASNDAKFQFSVNVVEGTGGSWLTTNVNDCCASTSQAINVTANPAQTLVAGSYTAEVLTTSSNGAESMVVPVTLTVEASSATYFEVPGAVTFSAQVNNATNPSQPLMIRNAGSGALDWMASISTADGNNWLSLSSTSGTSPSGISVSINRANLPSEGQVPGTFVGQITLQSIGDIVTVPVAVTIGDAVFEQPSAVSFSKSYQGVNPPTQSVTIASTDKNFQFSVSVITARSATGSRPVSMAAAPLPRPLTAHPAASLAAGTYAAEVIFTSSNGTEPMVIPVTLTVGSSSATATPTFNPPAGSYSTTQSVTISSSTADASIYYTIDGSTPTTSSTVYKWPVSVSNTTTLKAIALALGFPQSAVAQLVQPSTPACQHNRRRNAQVHR